MGCMANADFVVTSGILGVASARVGFRRYLPRVPRWARKVTDDEAREFVASLGRPQAPAAGDDSTTVTTAGAPPG